jgi:DUF1680 family protein
MTLPLADPTGGRPVRPSTGALRPLGLHEVRLTGGFWGRRQEVNSRHTLEHCRMWLEKLGWSTNFTAPPEGRSSVRRGREFSDSEVYKFLEATAWDLGRLPDGEREGEFTRLGAAVAAVQAPDGYLGTAFGGPGQPPRYADLAFGHELYCTGHLLQAAVARARTAGGGPLVDAARKAADHVCAAFGPDGNQGVCGHPEIETALVELARLTGEERYLAQAELFVDRRGHRTLPELPVGWSYFLDDIPVRRATVLRGHAVRALYLACGAVDVAVERGDDELLAAVAAQFARTWDRRTYLTGGMGSRHLDEAFGDDFVLPADRAYSETCAGVAAVMLAWRLLLATGEQRWADVMERVLFNVVATAVSDDGQSFFYANLLHQRTPTEETPADREILRFGGGPRAPWFEVSCCLPNVARLLATLSTYLVTADAEGLSLHQYADADIATRLDDGNEVALTMRTAYPDDGAVRVRVERADTRPWTLSLRVPPWARGAVLVTRGKDGTGERRAVPAGGTAVVGRAFAPGDEVRLELPVGPRWTFPDARIDAVRGCAAVERGPVVLCAEAVTGAGPERDLDTVAVDTRTPPLDEPGGAVVAARHRSPDGDGWPYTAEPPSSGDGPPRDGTAPLSLIPYHRWARRGPSTMRVWLPTER